MDDETLQYRTAVPSQAITAEPRQTRDDDNYDTLRAVYKELKSAVDGLDKWSAFDLQKNDDLSVEQQISVNQKVYEIVAPLLDGVEAAIETVDNKYRGK